MLFFSSLSHTHTFSLLTCSQTFNPSTNILIMLTAAIVILFYFRRSTSKQKFDCYVGLGTSPQICYVSFKMTANAVIENAVLLAGKIIVDWACCIFFYKLRRPGSIFESIMFVLEVLFFVLRTLNLHWKYFILFLLLILWNILNLSLCLLLYTISVV